MPEVRLAASKQGIIRTVALYCVRCVSGSVAGASSFGSKGTSGRSFRNFIRQMKPCLSLAFRILCCSVRVIVCKFKLV